VTARTAGQAAFEAAQRVLYPDPGARTAWGHPAVDTARPAWEAGGEAAIEFGAGAALVAAIAARRRDRELLARVRLILANGELSHSEGRTAALEVIQQSDQEGETTA
jgi:hypothetical protein